jgi:hypothetical protein
MLSRHRGSDWKTCRHERAQPPIAPSEIMGVAECMNAAASCARRHAAYGATIRAIRAFRLLAARLIKSA